MNVGQYWIDHVGTGVWRTAQRALDCTGPLPSHAIAPGERYLDTGERYGVWATHKCCAVCAAKPLTFEVQS